MLVLEYFFISLVCFFIGAYFYIFGYLFSGIWEIFMLDGLAFYIEVYLDFYSFFFMGVIFLVSSMIILYSFGYVDSYLSRFFYLMNLFVFSMVMLVVSPNLFSMILGWDGLGVVSFCLVGFYYNSESVLGCSMVTMLYNRLGDSLLLMVIGGSVFWDGVWSSWVGGWGLLFSLVCILGLCTKSAQYPFSSWLPQAMAAPTPVSSLVHSSTLVTAGMYILFRYVGVLGVGSSVLFFLSLFTMIIGGLSSVLVYDVKKIIAYSTLSQIGFMVGALSLGYLDYMFFHMIVHAFFKSMMFMCAGIFIHILGTQDVRMYGGLIYVAPLTLTSMIIGLMGLVGFPFISGFYSKDLIVEGVLSGNLGLLDFLGFTLGMIMTMSYSVRLMTYFLVEGVYVCPLFNLGEGLMSYCLVFLSLSVLLSGGVISGVGWDYNLFDCYGWLLNSLILFYLVVGILLGISDMMGFKFLLFVIIKGFYLDNYYYYFKSKVLFLSRELIIHDKYWIESVIGIRFYNFIYTYIDSFYLISYIYLFILCFLGISFFLFF